MPVHFSFNKAHFPADWEDDVRMNFLFSTFRERYINPEGYDAKLNFWSNTIKELCVKSRVPLITMDALSSALQRNGRQPLCLDIVFDYMIREGDFINSNDFNQVDQEKGWLQWGAVLIQKPIVWSLSSVNNLLNWTKKEQQFVVLPVVKDLANKLWDRYHELVDSKWTDNAVFLDHFQKECKHICFESHFQLAIIQLQKERRAQIFMYNGEKVIKFQREEDNRVQPLSELDKGILSLNRARDTITEDIETLEENIANCNEVAKKFVKLGLKKKAMMTLKKRKRLDAALQKKSIALDNIENLLCQLKNSGSEKMVLEAYKTGVKAMKGSFNNDLVIDDIDDVMADVKEVLDDYSEIQRTLGQLSSGDDSLEEYENELADILKEDKPKPTETRSPEHTEADLMKRLAALRAPPNDEPPAKKPFLKTAVKAL